MAEQPSANLNFSFASAMRQLHGFAPNPGMIISETLGRTSSIPGTALKRVISTAFAVKELAGSGDLGYGFWQAGGGAQNDPNFLKFSSLYGLIATPPSPTGGFSPLGGLAEAAGAVAGIAGAVEGIAGVAGTVAGVAGAVSDISSIAGNISSNLSFNIVLEKLNNTLLDLQPKVDIALKQGLGEEALGIARTVELSSQTIESVAMYLEGLGVENNSTTIRSLARQSLYYKDFTGTSGLQDATRLSDTVEILQSAINQVRIASIQVQSIGEFLPGISKINSTLGAALNADWNILNSTTGNSLIKSAFQITGRAYDRDGTSGPYSWAAPFVGSILASAGVIPLEAVSPQAYMKFGYPVNFRDIGSLRANDIMIFKTQQGLMHMGFLKSFDPVTRMISLVGGNQGGGSGALKTILSLTNPTFRLIKVRRAWTASKENDLPSEPVTPTSAPRGSERF